MDPRRTVDHSEVKALFDHYKSISGSVNKDGVIDKSEFVQALKLRADSVLTDRLFALFDGNGDTVINFRYAAAAAAAARPPSASRASAHLLLPALQRVPVRPLRLFQQGHV